LATETVSAGRVQKEGRDVRVIWRTTTPYGWERWRGEGEKKREGEERRREERGGDEGALRRPAISCRVDRVLSACKVRESGSRKGCG